MPTECPSREKLTLPFSFSKKLRVQCNKAMLPTRLKDTENDGSMNEPQRINSFRSKILVSVSVVERQISRNFSSTRLLHRLILRAKTDNIHDNRWFQLVLSPSLFESNTARLTGEVDLEISRKLEGFKHNIGSNNGCSRMDDPYLQFNNQAKKEKRNTHARKSCTKSDW